MFVHLELITEPLILYCSHEDGEQLPEILEELNRHIGFRESLGDFERH